MANNTEDLVRAELTYTGVVTEKPWVYGGEKSNVNKDVRVMPILDGRTLSSAPNLSREGFQLVRWPSAVTDFRNSDEVDRLYPDEIRRLILEVTGADEVIVSVGTILRFGERSHEAGTKGTTQAARLVHSDVSDKSGKDFARLGAPNNGRTVRRAAQHNIWRTFSTPPQDVPLAVCDARTVSPDDLLVSDYATTPDQKEQLSFEIMLVHHNPAHRWIFFSNMHRDEAIVFKRHDSDESEPGIVPHSAFTHPHVPDDAEPRASIEIRTIAYWYE